MPKISQGEMLEQGHGHEEEKIPSVNTKEEMFQLLEDGHYSHNPDRTSGISKRDVEKGAYWLTCNMGSAPIKSEATIEKLQQWYDEFYPDKNEDND